MLEEKKRRKIKRKIRKKKKMKVPPKWTSGSDPFIVVVAYPHGAMEIQYEVSKHFKVNDHQLTHYFSGEIDNRKAFVT